jgi:hypothetical protein
VRSHRLTIAALMGGVAIAALAFAALREPESALWASITFGTATLVLAVATLGALYRRGPTWVGFVAFGWAYLLWAYGPWGLQATPVPATPSSHLLYASSLRLHAGLRNSSWARNSEVPTSSVRRVGGKFVQVPYPYLQSGESLVSLLVACVGAVTGRLVAGPRGRARSGAAADGEEPR